MICPECKTRNPIGNKFCRECGARLGAPDGALAREETARVETERREERVAALLAEATALADEEKPHDALALVEEAVALTPGSTSAQALLASLYERTGQVARAIEAMEIVAALNPDSEADREKLDQLRRGVHVRPVPVRARALPAWVPLAAAGAVTALVLGFGLSLLRSSQNPEEERPAARGAFASRPSVPPTPPQASGAAIPAPSFPTVRSDPFASSSGTPQAVSPLPPQPATPGDLPARRQGSVSASALPGLPAPREGSTAGISNPPRFRSNTPAAPRALPPLGSNPAIAVAPPTNTFGGNTERIRVIAPPTSAASQSTTPPSQERPANGGYIRIRVGPPAGNDTPGRTPPAESTDPLLRAQSLQAAGRYGEAAAAYRQALGALSGGAAGEAYQSLALCEQRLGNTDAARAAYRQAIAAYETAAGSAARQGIAACRAALEVLGNG